MVFTSLLALAAAARADYTLYNQSNPPTPNASGTANFGAAGFNLTLNDPAFTVELTAPSATPLPAAIRLTSLGLVRGTGGNGPAIETDVHYLKVFSGVPAAGNFVGVSSNFQNFDDGLAAAVQTYTFTGLDLSTSTNYIFAFASNGAADASGLNLLGRVQGSNLAADVYGGSFLSPGYTTNADPGTQRDPMLRIGATEVPEPAMLSVCAAGALLVLRRRH